MVRTKIVHDTLLDQRADGDLNGDGKAEAAVLLEVDSGSSGHKIYLAVMADVDGVARNIDTILAGDRAQVEGIAVADGNVQLNLVVNRGEWCRCL